MVQQASDQRPNISPSHSVSYPRACAAGGGRFHAAGDSSRAVIAGNEVLRILKISDTGVGEGNNSSRTCTGPGGATIEAGSNIWNGSGLKVDSAPTDVVWTKGHFDNKIVTSARNGEIIYWDINKQGNKCEIRVKEHKRAVNKLALSSFLPYLFASGSQDGYLRMWDLRAPTVSTMKVYHATPIRTLAMCPVPSHPFQVCVGLESGNIQRWDLRSKAQPLERITLAHSSAVLSMDWQQPSMRESGLGWLVTSGMDRRVKIWDLTLPFPLATTSDRETLIKSKKMGLGGPMRTLYPSFVGRCVRWRPGCDTEVTIVSSNDDGSAVEIWDIRRGWIGKWAMDSTEGVITDAAFSSMDTLHALHTSGTFAQYDLRVDQYDNASKPSSPLLYKPLDAVPRVAMTWTPKGDIAFVADRKDEDEVPFDDRITKTTSDPVYLPREQTIGAIPLLSGFGFETGMVERLARGYMLGSESNIPRRDVCEINARKAAEEGQVNAARVWEVLAGLLDVSKPIIREDEETDDIPPPQSKDETITEEVLSLQATDTRHLQLSLHSSPRTSSLSPRIQVSTHPDSSSPHPTPSPSPRLSTIALPPDPRMSPVSMYDASISSAGISSKGKGTGSVYEPAARRSSILSPRRLAALGAQSTVSRPEVRRMSVSVPYTGGGALDDSDSESISENGDAEGGDGVDIDVEGGDSVEMVISVGDGRGRIKFEENRMSSSFMEPSLTSTRASSTTDRSSSASLTTANRSSSFTAPRTTCYAPRIPSPNGRSRSLFTRQVQPSPSPLSKSVQLREGSPDSHLASDERSIGEHEDDEDSDSQSGSGSQSGSSSGSEQGLGLATNGPRVSRSLVRSRESLSSIKTVTDHPPSPPRSAVETFAAVTSIEDSSTRKPSPQPAAVSGLGLSNMGTTVVEEPTVMTISKRVVKEEVMWTNIVWDALKETVAEFADMGDVQMCALLAIVAPKELGIGSVRGGRFVDAYVDILSRLQLHALAAHVRKYAPYELVRDTTQVQTTVFAACGQCNTTIKFRTPGTAFICEKCKSRPTLCAICHIPVRKLLVHCSTCGHGGHQACYRAFYLTRPLADIPPMNIFNHGHSASSTIDSYSTESSTYYSLSDGDTLREEGSLDDDTGSDSVPGLREEERAKPRVRMRVLGHACAAGCGHWCWAANERFGGGITDGR